MWCTRCFRWLNVNKSTTSDGTQKWENSRASETRSKVGVCVCEVKCVSYGTETVYCYSYSVIMKLPSDISCTNKLSNYIKVALCFTFPQFHFLPFFLFLLRPFDAATHQVLGIHRISKLFKIFSLNATTPRVTSFTYFFSLSLYRLVNIKPSDIHTRTSIAVICFNRVKEKREKITK